MATVGKAVTPSSCRTCSRTAIRRIHSSTMCSNRYSTTSIPNVTATWLPIKMFHRTKSLRFPISMVDCLNLTRAMTPHLPSHLALCRSCSTSSPLITSLSTRTPPTMWKLAWTPRCWVASLRTCWRTTRRRVPSTRLRKSCNTCVASRSLLILRRV